MFHIHYLLVSHLYIFKQAEFTPEELNSRKRSLNLEVCVPLQSLLETHLMYVGLLCRCES